MQTTTNHSLTDSTERRKAYDRFIESIAGVFDMDMEKITQRADASWEHLRYFEAYVWKQLETIAAAEWEGWPKNLVYRIKATIENRRLQVFESFTRSFCEYCNGNGHFTGVVVQTYGSKPILSEHTIICRGCNNAAAVFGEKTIKACHNLFPLEAITGNLPYVEVVIPAPTGETFGQAIAWKEKTGQNLPHRHKRKSEERSALA